MQFWQNFQKKKKHHIFSDSALQLADDIFTVAVDYDMDDEDEDEEVSQSPAAFVSSVRSGEEQRTGPVVNVWFTFYGHLKRHFLGLSG